MANIIYKINQGETDYNIASSAYCTCSTAAGTVAKVAYLHNSSSNGFTLATGVTIHVKFTYSNTASKPTLNVNSTGAKSIMRYGATNVGGTVPTSWRAGAIVTFTYDGTNWVLNSSIDDNTTYGVMTAGSLGLGKPIAHYYQTTATWNGNAFPSSPSPIDASGAKTVDINSLTSTAGRNYGVVADKEGRLFVNVPWTSSTINNAGFAAKPIYIENGEAKQCTGLSAELPIPDYGSGIALGDAVDAACNPNVSIATSTGTNQLTLSHGSKYSISVNGKGFIFTMPSQYSLPLAASGTRGGVQIGYSASNANIPLKLSSEKGYVTLTGTAIKHAIDNGGDLSWTASSYTFKDGTSNESLKLDGSLMYQNGSGTTKMVVGNTGNMGIAGYLYQYSNTSKRAPWSSTVYNIEKVTALPASPDANTLYIIV